MGAKGRNGEAMERWGESGKRGKGQEAAGLPAIRSMGGKTAYNNPHTPRTGTENGREGCRSSSPPCRAADWSSLRAAAESETHSPGLILVTFTRV
jgi:hypothetical protein